VLASTYRRVLAAERVNPQKHPMHDRCQGPESRPAHGRVTFCCSGNGGECTPLMHGYAKIGQFFKSSYREIIYISGR
jgi:hypothetical protein